jgi:hypothetical protein
MKERRFDDALSLLNEAYAIHRALGERIEIGNVLSSLANVLALAGRMEKATRLLARSTALYEEFGTQQVWASDRDAETLELLHAQAGDPAFELAWEEGRELTIDEAVALALS